MTINKSFNFSNTLGKCFGEQAHSAYIIGSNAVGQGSISGDIDLVIIVEDSSSYKCQLGADRLRKIYFFLYDVNLDINLRQRDEILKNGCEYVRLSGVNVFGDNIKYKINIPSQTIYKERLQNNFKKSLKSFYESMPLGQISTAAKVNSRIYRNIISNICRLLIFDKFNIYTSQRPEAVEIYKTCVDKDFNLYDDFFEVASRMTKEPDFELLFDDRLLKFITGVRFDG